MKRYSVGIRGRSAQEEIGWRRDGNEKDKRQKFKGEKRACP